MGRKKTVKAVIITLILTVLLVGGVAFFLSKQQSDKLNEKIAELNARIAKTNVYAFSKDKKAGSVITPEDIAPIEITNTSKTAGMYLDSRPSELDPTKLEYAESFTDKDGQEHDYAFRYFIDENGDEVYMQVVIDEELYGREVKANVSTNTPVLDALLYAKNNTSTKDERFEEMSDSFMSIPSDIDAGDYFDFRIRFADGEDFVVLSGKKVDKLGIGEDGRYTSSHSIFTTLSEEERMLYTSALIEAYVNEGTILYATKLVDPSTQLFKETIENYVEKYKEGINLAIKAKEMEYILKKMEENGEEASVEIFESLSEEDKEKRRAEVPVIDSTKFTDAEIAKYAGMKEEYVTQIKEALKDKNEDNETLKFFRQFRVQTKTPLECTYAVTDAVRNAIIRTPNILDEVKNGFIQRAETAATRDRFKELEIQYANAPERKDGYYGNDVKTKEEVKAMIDALSKQYGEKYQEAVKKQQERRDYLISMIYENED